MTNVNWKELGLSRDIIETRKHKDASAAIEARKQAIDSSIKAVETRKKAGHKLGQHHKEGCYDINYHFHGAYITLVGGGTGSFVEGEHFKLNIDLTEDEFLSILKIAKRQGGDHA